MDCQICLYTFTSKRRQKYTCLECLESVCTSCIFKYTMNNFGNFQCMFCHTKTCITTIRNFMSASQYKRIANKEIENLFNIEISLLEDTKKILDEEQRITEIQTIFNRMKNDGLSEVQILAKLNQMGYLKEKIHDQFVIIHCPKCFIRFQTKKDDENLKCESCNINICWKCNQEEKENHKCDQDILKTVELIHSTCNTCPQCHTIIEKENGGCDQMFCTKCNTSFSWTTRRILKQDEIRHNPHFYEWQRKQKNLSRHPLDNPCEGHFLIKCQTDLKHTLHPGFLIAFQQMILELIETFLIIQERDDLIRYQFRAQYLTKNFTYNNWKLHFKRHINTLRRNNEVKDLFLICLDSLYYITLNNGNISEFDELFKLIAESLQIVQLNYGKIFQLNYLINIENIILPL